MNIAKVLSVSTAQSVPYQALGLEAELQLDNNERISIQVDGDGRTSIGYNDVMVIDCLGNPKNVQFVNLQIALAKVRSMSWEDFIELYNDVQRGYYDGIFWK